MIPGMMKQSPADFARAPSPALLTGRNPVFSLSLLAIGGIILLLGVLLFLLQQRDAKEQRETLITDVLWLEQGLQFQLSSDTEKLQQLTAGTWTASQAASRAAVVMGTNPEIQRIRWYDARGTLVASEPPAGDAAPQGLGETELAFVRKLGRPVFSAPRQLSTGPDRWGIDLVLPIFRDNQFVGALGGVISLDALLANQVPWWLTARYQVSLLDGSGRRIVDKSNVDLDRSGPSYEVPLDPPGHDLSLRIMAYHDATHLARNIIAAAMLLLAASAIAGLWATLRQARRRIASEQALKEEYLFRKAMEDSLNVGLRARDMDGKIIYVNPAFCKMVERPPEQLVGATPPMPYWAPDELERTLEANRATLSGQAPEGGFELRFQRASGERFDALIHEAPLIDASGRQTGWMGSVVDITERKRADERARQEQDKLQHTARLISMGEMASTLAHELNQPLAAIVNYSAGCQEAIKGGMPLAEISDALGKLHAQALRAGQIIRRVHDFVRKREPVLARCAIDDLIRGTVEFFGPDVRRRRMALKVSLPKVPLIAAADRILVEQVIINLLRNGMEAMTQTEPKQRRLDIAAREVDQSIEIAVTDRGRGISPEAAAHLFEPFVTTKIEGMGIGLNICRSIIEFHGGRLWHEDNPGGGTIFRFTLPRAVNAA